jgi:hypothetical protein
MSTVTSLAPSTLTEAIAYAERIAKSSMIPPAFRNKPEDVLVTLQMGAELGLAPLQALQNIACINGKPSIYGDAALALVKASPVCDDVRENEIGSRGDGDRWGYKCIAIRKGKAPVEVTFTVADAKKAGLWGKPGPWQNYDKRMLQMRARGFALRDAFPDVLRGLITAEEAQDLPTPEKEVNARPTKAAPRPAPQAKGEVIDASTGEVLPQPSSEPQPQTPSAAPSASNSSEPDPNAWPLYIPGQEAPFAVYPDGEQWKGGFEQIENNICASKKLGTKKKQEKLRDLRDANELGARTRMDDEALTNWLKVRQEVLTGLEKDAAAAEATS